MPIATHADADIVMRLYELRREEVMRKARQYMVGEFWPRTAAEILDLAGATGKQENAYFRQVITFAEMAVSLPMNGAVHNDLFVSWNGELIFLFAKFKPFLAEVRKTNPGFLINVEKFIQSSKSAQERLEGLAPRVKKMAEAAHAK